MKLTLRLGNALAFGGILAAGATLPTYFERNVGQAPTRAEFVVRSAGYSALLTPGGAELSLKHGAQVKLRWKGANRAPAIEGISPLEARSNYFIGSDPLQWKRDVRQYGKVLYRGVYPGIDIVFYANGSGLEHDFDIAPGADPHKIRITFDGVRAVRLDASGDLVLDTPEGLIHQKKPAIYQDGKQSISGGWALAGKREARFEIGPYDHSKPLTIDPIISVTTYVGGGPNDSPNAVAVGADGSIYVAGNTSATSFPGINGVQTKYGGGPNDAFVVKLDFTGSKIVYATYLGGSGNDIASAIQVDPAGNAYVAGFTSSTNFPAHTGQQSYGGGGYDAFVAKIGPAGNTLLYSTYVGGNGTDIAYALAIDAAGSAYLAGATNSTNFPVAGPYQGHLAGSINAFVAKLDPGGSSVVYGTYLGGSGQDAANALVLDSAGKIYVAGMTSSPNFPTSAGSVQQKLKGGNNAFIARLDPAGGSNGLLYGTYLGGSGSDTANGMALDDQGELLVVGTTSSPDFPVTPGSPSYGGAPSDGFLAMFSVPSGVLPNASAALGTHKALPRVSTVPIQETFVNYAGGPAGTQIFSAAARVSPGSLTATFDIVGSTSSPSAERYTPLVDPPLPTDLGWIRDGDNVGNEIYRSSLPVDAAAVVSTPNRTVVVGRSTDHNVPTTGSPSGAAVQVIQQEYGSEGANNKCPCGADPISSATGELFDSFADLALGGPLPLDFRRYYGSLLLSNNFTSALGANWMHNFDVRMLVSGTAAIVYLYGGKSVQFLLTNGGWQLTSVEKYDYQLQNGPSGSYLFLDPTENRIYAFNSGLQLTSIADRNANTLTITQGPAGPTKVSDGLGRSLTFSYQGNNLTGVTDQAGRSLSFTQTSGNLTSFTNANGKKYSYSYTGSRTRPSLIVSTTEPLGNTPFTQAYDTAGRVISQTDGLGLSATLSYDQGALGTNSFTDARSNMTSYVQPDFQNPVTVTDANGKSRTATYDSQNRITSVTDRLGNTTILTYHLPSGKLASSTDALGNTTSYAYTAQTQNGFTYYMLSGAAFADGTSMKFRYGASGNLTQATDPAGNNIVLTYNSAGQVLTVTNAAGGVTTITYSADGMQASTKTPAGDTTNYAYDTARRLIGLNLADASTLAFGYDNLNNILKLTDQLGHASSFVYNDNSFESALTDPIGKQASLSYDADDHVTASTDRNGQTTTFAYGPDGLLKTITSPAGETENFTYDTLNQVSSVLDATGKGYSFGRDGESRVTSIVDALSRKFTFTLDPLGRITQMTTPQVESHAFAYDSLGRLVKTTNPLGQSNSYSYDSRGFLTGITLPAGLAAQYQNNALGRVTSVTDPNGNAWRRTYDSMGRKTSQSDPLGRKIGVTYNSRNRVTSVTLPDATVNVTWDAASNLTGLQYADGTKLHYSYDADNRLVSADGLELAYDGEGNVTSSNGLTITRDAVGRVASVQYATGKNVKYAYDNRGLLTSITDWNGGVTTLVQDAAGQLVSVTRPNGVATLLSHDGDGRINSITETNGAKMLSAINLTRDAEGKIISAIRNAPQAAAPPPGVLNLGYDAADQIASATYDGEGRITKDAIRSYKWDQSSALASYSGADGSAAFTYDALGLRTSSSSTTASQNYVWNYALGQPAIATVQSGGKDLRYYVCTPEGTVLYSMEAADSARHFYHFDEVGSTVMLTDDSGNITDSYAATPYGESIIHSGSSDNPFTWLGGLGVMQEGSTGMYYMRERYYDSAAARFLSPDPVASLDPLALNPYQYALGDPMRWADPSGMQDASLYTPLRPFFAPGGPNEEWATPPNRGSQFFWITDPLAPSGPHFFSPNPFRLSDSYTLSAGVPTIIPGMGLHVDFTVDRYGTGYIGGGPAFGLGANETGASLTANWLFQDSTPSPGDLSSFTTGPSVGVQGGFIFGGAYTFSPTSPRSRFSQGLGLTTPGLALSFGYTSTWQDFKGHFLDDVPPPALSGPPAAAVPTAPPAPARTPCPSRPAAPASPPSQPGVITRFVNWVLSFF